MGLHSDSFDFGNSDFDRVISRRGTDAIAVDAFRDYLLHDHKDLQLPCDDGDVIPMWVADMAFATPPTVVDAMRERLEHPIFGYTVLADDQFYEAFAGWCNDRYQWRPERDHVFASTGVVPTLYSLVDYFVGPGQKVFTLTPAYGFFKPPVTDRGREFVACSLLNHGGHYEIDFDAFEKTATDPAVRMFFLCHPHNPTGRIWTDDELTRMAQLCFDNDVIVVSDEIHCDLLRSGLRHTPLAKLFPESDQIITCMSSSKTFNLAGLGISQIVIPGDELRTVWQDRGSPVVNPISMAAATATFRSGEPWRRELLAYLDQNFAYVDETITAELPNATFVVPDATYLGWIDLGSYFPPDTDLTRYFAETAGVLLEDGSLFVADGAGYIRINVACPRSTLVDGISKIVAATLRS
jgi:cystathionine beta-lyase